MKPLKPKPLKPTRRWCIVTQRGGLVKSIIGDIINRKTYRETARFLRPSHGERVALIEMREVLSGRR